MKWKKGDWVVFDLRVGQVKDIRNGCEVFSDGSIEISGVLAGRMRKLTLRNKAIVEWFSTVYNRLYDIRGSQGFNFPDIHQYFSSLALSAIDADEVSTREFHERATNFVTDARDYKPVVQGVLLFRAAR